MTLDDLDDFLRRPDVASVTLSVAANGKAYCTAHFLQPNGSFKPENQWAATIEEGLTAILARPEASEDEDLLI